MKRSELNDVLSDLHEFIMYMKDIYGSDTAVLVFRLSSTQHISIDNNYTKQKLKTFLENEWNKFLSRFTDLDISPVIQFGIQRVSFTTLLSCKFTEFFNCCGKVICHSLYMSLDIGDLTKTNTINKVELLNKYFHVAKLFLTASPYTSMSAIISIENGQLMSLFPRLERFKLVNEFISQRTSGKNLCKEYEFNLDY